MAPLLSEENHRESTWDWESPAVSRECGTPSKPKRREKKRPEDGEREREKDGDE
ncbi:hypothetical protein [Aeropyrum camini]|uniref:Glutamine synthetase adenylyltransferase n=1 Tax=Aeropyrum camini SY1 = JCM 12091 TaxID=1198449 RepID=U3TGA1_9CREN|nr:hypothetical protein [Aeropyrum camini]BAN91028.1 glutamine synthetase adenylyltransferase [Aeropyrum camini SY1 = JCM 12091]